MLQRASSLSHVCFQSFAARFLLLLAVCMLCAPGAWAQGLGEIQGTVTDPSGALIAGATVVATQANTGHVVTVISNRNGLYILSTLQPAGYSLTVSAPGFSNFHQSGIVLQADQDITLNIKLPVGSDQSTVSVTANAVQVNTSNATLSQVMDQDKVEGLPLNGRNAAQLTLLVAGAVLGPTDGTDQGLTKSFPEVVTPSFNGTRVYQTNYMLDGGNNVDEYTNANGPFPFPDALQEFSVQTSNYNAEYGQNAGGVVNIIIKSGSPQYHGLLFEFVRNRIFNAACYFCYQTLTPGGAPVKTVDPLKRNQFGGTFSGPLAIPHLLSGKNTFFFFGYQKSIIHTVTSSSVYLPTDAERSGDFSALLTVNPNNPIGKAEKLKSPVTGKAYTNGQIPVSSFDPAAVSFLNDLPHTTGNGQYYFGHPFLESFNEYVARVDQNFGSKDQLFGHYFDDAFSVAGILTPGNLLTYSDISTIHFRSALLAETHTFSSHIVNNLNFNYLNEVSIRNPPTGAPSVTDFGVNVWQPYQKAIQRIQASGYFTLGQNPYAFFERNSYNFSDDVHWVKGNHDIAFGVHNEVSKTDNGGLGQASGLFVFKSARAGDAIASLLTGYMSTFTQAAGGSLDAIRNIFQGYYVQDTWKIGRRLSVSYGLRYEPYRAWTEQDGKNNTFVPSAYIAGTKSTIYTGAPKGLFFPGEQGIAPQGFRPIKTDFMPRVGFAYDVFGNGLTSLRAGAGIFYDTRIQSAYNANGNSASNYSSVLTNPGGANPGGPFSNPYSNGITNPFPRVPALGHAEAFPNPTQVYTFDPNGYFPPPVTYEWNLTVEQQFTKNLLSRISYVGSQNAHNTTFVELNPTIDGVRFRPEYSTITDSDNGANSSYHSLQVSLQQRLSHGLTVLANYTWSKSIDDLPYQPGNSYSYTLPVTWSPDLIAAYQAANYNVSYGNFRALDRGLSDFDRRNVLSVSYVWKLPKLGPQNLLPLRAVVNGWETTGVIQSQSGDALTVISSGDQSQTGIGQDRGVYSGGSLYNKGNCGTASGPCRSWLNTASFALPAGPAVAPAAPNSVANTFGNIRKGFLTGPGFQDWDAGLYRTFPIHERLNLQFRAEYFNLLNHNNPGDPNVDLSGGNFGNITSQTGPTVAYAARIAQLALKLKF